MEGKIDAILGQMGLRAGSGGTIVEIKWIWPGDANLGTGRVRQVELDYNHAMQFANKVYNDLNLPVKVYSKSTPTAVFADLKVSESELKLPGSGGFPPTYGEQRLNEAFKFLGENEPPHQFAFAVGEYVYFRHPTLQGEHRGVLKTFSTGATHASVSFGGYTYDVQVKDMWPESYYKARLAKYSPADAKGIADVIQTGKVDAELAKRSRDREKLNKDLQLPEYIKVGTRPEGLYRDLWDYLMGYMGNESRSVKEIIDRAPGNLLSARGFLPSSLDQRSLPIILSEMLANHSLLEARAPHKESLDYIIQQDKRGDLYITVPDEPGKSVFLQFESDKDLILEILTGDEPQDLANGYKVGIPANEPRSSVLQDLWENATLDNPPYDKTSFSGLSGDTEIVKTLRRSMDEEYKANRDYITRAEFARTHGHPEIAEKYEEIAAEEQQHHDEEQKMLHYIRFFIGHG